MAKKQTPIVVPTNSVREEALKMASKADKTVGYSHEIASKIGAGEEAKYAGLQSVYKQKEGDIFDPYEDYVDRNTLHGGQFSIEELGKIRAQNQSNWEQAGHAIGRVAVNIVPQVIGGLSSMVDLPGYFSAEEAANNQLVNWAQDVKKEVDEDWFPIYEENPGQSMSLSDPAWWMSRGSGLVESMGAFFVQGMVGGKIASTVLGGIGKLTKGKDLARAVLGANKSQRLLGGAEALTNATMLNQAEATIDATQVFNDTYKQRLAEGWDVPQAKKAAAEAAATTMSINKINILLNLSSAAAFLKPLKGGSRNLLELTSGLGKIAELAKEGGQEGLEELVNLVAQNAGTAKGKGEKYTMKDALNDMGSMEGFEAAFLGALGGIGQTGITKASEYSKYGAGNTTDAEGNRISKVEYERTQYAKQQEVINELKEKGVNVTDVMKNFKDNLLFQEKLMEAERKGDQAEVDKLKEELFESQAIKAFQSGTTEVLENLYKAEAAKDPEEVGQDHIDRANDALGQLKQLESVYNNFEGYENVDEIFFNRANKNRVERNLKYVETLKKDSDFQLSKDLHSIAKKYSYERERPILIKENGEVVRTETAIDTIPLSYSMSNLDENQGHTEAEQKIYDKFLAEVKALPSYQNSINYGEEVDKMQNLATTADQEFAEITSKKYQATFAEKKAKEAEKKAAFETISKSTSIAEVEKLRDAFDDPVLKKAAENKLADLKRANAIAAKQKQTALAVQTFNDRIKNATEDQLEQLRTEIEEAELSENHKTDLNLALDKKIRALNGEQTEEDIEEDAEEDNPLANVDSRTPEEIAAEVEKENASFDTTLPKDLPNPNTEKENVETEVGEAAVNLAQEDKTLVIGEDAEGNLIYSYDKSSEGYNRAAYLSKEFNQTEVAGVVYRSEIDDSVDNLELLDPDYLNSGAELNLQVDSEYEGEKYDPTSNTREKISWSMREMELQKQADAQGIPLTSLPEYIAEVPIKVTDKEGNTVFYVHDNAWYREENLNATAEEIAEDKARNFKIRETIVKKGEPVKSKVQYKSFGRLFKTFDGRSIPVSTAMPDSNLILAVGRDGSFELPGNANKVLDGGTILNSQVSEGRLYAIVKVGPKNYMPIPLERKPISKEVIDTIMLAVEAHLTGDEENPVVKAIRESSLGLEINTTEGLRQYLNQFIYLFPTEGSAGLENYLIVGGKNSNTLKSNMPLISVTPTGIEFGRPGVTMGSYVDKNGNKVTKCAIKLSANFKSKGGQATNAAGLEKLRALLENPSYTPLANASRKDLAKGADSVLILDEEGNTKTMKYSDLVKASHQTNVLSVNIGTEEDPKWAYTIQPTILFDTAFANIKPTKKKAAAKPKINKVTPAQKSSLRYKGVNPTVDVIVTKVINGEPHVLIIKRGATAKAEPNKLAFPGGFHDTTAKAGNKWKPGKESAEEAAMREVKEETGLDLEGLALEKVGVFDDRNRDPRNSNTSWISSTVYKVTIPEDFSGSTEVSGKDDAQDARWIPVSELSATDKSQFGFDHAAILESEGIVAFTSSEETEATPEGAEQEVETLTGEALVEAYAQDIVNGIENKAQLEQYLENLKEGLVPESDAIDMGFSSLVEATTSFERALEIFNENESDTKTITLPNGLKVTSNKNTKDADELGDESMDQVDELMIPIEENQLLVQKEEIDQMLIRGLDTATQSSLIAYLSSDIIQQTLSAKEVGGLKSVKVKPILDKHLESLKLLSTFYKEQGLVNKAARLDAIVDQFDKVRRLVNQNMSLFSTGTVKEDIELDDNENAGGLVRNNYTDDWAFTVNPKSTTSEDLKKFFSIIQAQDEDGPIVNFLGLPEILPYDTVYNTLKGILANKPADYDLMLKVLELNTEKFPWIKSVVELLEDSATPDKIKNEFVSGMVGHNIHMQFVMWSKDRNGNYSLQKWSSNSSAVEERLRAVWNSNLKGVGTRSNLVTVNEDDEYIFDKSVGEALVAQAAEFAKNPAAVTNDELANWLGLFGIVISDKTYEDLRKGKFNNNGRKSWNALFTGGKGLVKALAKSLDSKLKGEVSFDDAKLLTDSVVKALAKLEAGNNLSVYSNSFQAGGKTVYSYGNNNFLVNRMRDLTAYNAETGTFVNADLINRLQNISFSKNSSWLKDLTNTDDLGATMRNTFRINYLSLEALKKAFTRSQDNRKLNNLTTAEHEVIKIAFFQNVSGDNYDGEDRRAVDFFYPTMSDKTTMLTISALTRQLNLEDGEISEGNLETLYDTIVVPEINRIRDKQSSNIKGYEPNYFYFFHSLNSLMVPMGIDVNGNVTEKSFLDIVKDKDSTIHSPEVKQAVMEEIKSIFNNLLDSKLEDWTKLGIGLKIKDKNNRVTDNFTFLDKEYMSKVAKVGKGTDKVRYAAMDYVFNNLIANAEAHKLFAGDPALYAKFNSKRSLTENLQETFTNIGKRLAGDIAPGMELANSADNNYYQVFMKDKEIDSNNVKDTAQKEFFTKIMDKFGSNYSGIEGSDAQEYTTWKEHLYVMQQLGRLTKAQYDKIYQKLEAQSRGEMKISNRLTYTELGIIMQPLKPVYVGNTASVEDNADRRVYIKSSSFPLIPELTKGMQIDKIRQGLESFEEEVSGTTKDGKPAFVRASFGTANKVGAVKNAVEVFDNDGNVVDNFKVKLDNTLLLSRSNFRIQQDVPYKREKDAVNIGTQERKLLFVNTLDLEIEPGVTGQDLMELYNQNYEDLYEYAYEELSKKLGLVKEVTTTKDLTSLLELPFSDGIVPSIFEQVADLEEQVKTASAVKTIELYQDFTDAVGDNTLERVNFINKNFDNIVEALMSSDMAIFKDENNEFKKC